MATTLVGKTDLQIQEDVLRELRADTRVRATEVGVAVKAGVVTLSGFVDSWAKRWAAQQCAHRVVGVLDVANDLEVRIPGTGARTDTDIAAAVRSALLWDVFVPDQRIRSTVSLGVVTLEGEVEFLHQREDAARAVRNLAGVLAVINEIVVASHVVLPAKKVRGAIEAALQRRASQEAKALSVRVTDGTVTVSGEVESWPEKQAALGAARSIEGVRDVVDLITVNPWQE